MKLLHGYQLADCSLRVYSDFHHVGASTMAKWIKLFLKGGLANLRRAEHNRHYSTYTKLTAVKAYQSGRYTRQEILEHFNIRNVSQLRDWIIKYNSDQEGTTGVVRKRVRNVGRKVSFEEKKQIVQWLLGHELNYQAAADKYNVSYDRVYSWVRKYRKAYDWNDLKDRRGRRKPKEEPDSNDKEAQLRQRIKDLEAKNRRMEVEIALSKKLVEIYNREVKQADEIKRFKR